MSDEKNAPLEFSAFDLMPEWAQEKSETKPDAQKFKHREDDGDRGPKGRRGGGGNFERRGGPRDNNRNQRGGGGGGGYRNDRRGGGGDRDQRGGGDRDRRGGGGGGRRDFRGGDRRGGGFQRDQDENFEINGLKLTFEPTPAAAKSLSKHIQESVKAYPVADLAKMVANSRERYQIRLKSDKNGPALFQGKEDGSAWLSRDEAISNFLRSKKQLSKYYVIEEVELEAPKGNFSTIAVCGFSGEILGPPNHHEYQSNIARIHREKFSDMSLERYKQRIQMESGEEILTKWQEKVSKAFHFRLKSDQPEIVVEEVAEPAAEEVVAEETATGDVEAPEGEVVEETPEVAELGPVEEEAVAEETTPPVEDPSPSEPASEGETPAEEEASPEPEAQPEPKKPEGIVIKTKEELERHFRQNYAADEFIEAREVVLPGNIAGQKLSQDLLSLLKSESRKLRRGFPFEMFQSVCSCLENEGLKFFKRGKKALHVSMVRPQAISSSLSLTDRIQKIITLITESPRIPTVEVLEKMCPSFHPPDPKDKDAKIELDAGAKGVLADIRWLAMEGFIVEFPDTRLEIGKSNRPEGTLPQKGNSKKSGSPKKKGATPQGKKLPGGICTFNVVDPVPEKKVKEAETVAAKPEVVVETAPVEAEIAVETLAAEPEVAVGPAPAEPEVVGETAPAEPDIAVESKPVTVEDTTESGEVKPQGEA